MTSNRNVTINRDVIGTVITTGDSNIVTAKVKVTLPPAESVSILEAVSDLRQLMNELISTPSLKLSNALAEVEEEAAKSEPDKAMLAEPFERVVKYVQEAESFAAHSEKLVARFAPIISWLGTHANKIINTLGLL